MWILSIRSINMIISDGAARHSHGQDVFRSGSGFFDFVPIEKLVPIMTSSLVPMTSTSATLMGNPSRFTVQSVCLSLIYLQTIMKCHFFYIMQ